MAPSASDPTLRTGDEPGRWQQDDVKEKNIVNKMTVAELDHELLFYGDAFKEGNATSSGR